MTTSVVKINGVSTVVDNATGQPVSVTRRTNQADCVIPTVSSVTGGSRLAIQEINQRLIWDTEQIVTGGNLTYAYFTNPKGSLGIGNWAAANGKTEIDTSMDDSGAMLFNENIALTAISMQLIHIGTRAVPIEPTTLDMNNLLFNTWLEFKTTNTKLWYMKTHFIGSIGGYRIKVGAGAAITDYQHGNITKSNYTEIEPIAIEAQRQFKVELKTNPEFVLANSIRLRIAFDGLKSGSSI